MLIDIYTSVYMYVLVTGSAFHTVEHIMYVNIYSMNVYVLFI